MALGVLALGSLILSIALRQRPGTAVLASLVVWVLLPEAALHQALGVQIHPAAMIAIGTFIFSWFDDAFAGRKQDKHSFLLIVTWTALALLAMQQILVNRNHTTFVIEQMVATFALVWLCLRVPPADRFLFRDRVARTFVALAALNAVLAFVQYRQGAAVPFDAYFAREYYWYTPNLTRWMGTTDQPLELSVLLAVSTFMLPVIKRPSLRLGLAFLFLMAMLVTQSRTGIVALGIGVLLVTVTSKMTALQRVGIGALLVVSSTWVWSAFLESKTYTRFSTAGRSTQARSFAYDRYFDLRPAHFWPGGGPGYSYTWAESHGLLSSLENPLLMFSLDYGYLFTATYAVLALGLLVRGVASKAPLNFIGAAAVGVGLSVGFSSFASATAMPAIVWIPLGVAALGRLAEPGSTADAEAVAIESASGGSDPRRRTGVTARPLSM